MQSRDRFEKEVKKETQLSNVYLEKIAMFGTVKALASAVKPWAKAGVGVAKDAAGVAGKSLLDLSKGKAPGSIKGATNAVGKTIDKAFFQGAYKDHAIKHEITNPNVLMKLDGSGKGLHELDKAVRKQDYYKNGKKTTSYNFGDRKARSKDLNGPSQKATLSARSEVHEKLRDETRRAKLAVGGTVAAGVYGHKKLNDKIDEIKSRQQYSYTY